MVGELHKRGYQKVRIAPTRHQLWHCVLTPVSNISNAHGARLGSYDVALEAEYTDPMQNRYFGWEDQKTATARKLADTFIQRFPRIAEAGKGRDWAYVGWYVELLGIAERGWFPYAYGGDESIMSLDAIPDSGVNLDDKPVLPLPPPGDHLDQLPAFGGGR
jgi:hypothetical protein